METWIQLSANILHTVEVTGSIPNLKGRNYRITHRAGHIADWSNLLLRSTLIAKINYLWNNIIAKTKEA